MKYPLERNDGGIASASVSATGTLVAPVPAALPMTTPSRLADYVALAKPRISVLVLIVTALGFCVATPTGVDGLLLFHALLGTACVAVAANALNQVMERDFDRRMGRTADRPLPAGRLRASDAAVFAGVLGVAGLAYLMIFANSLAAFLAGATIVLYLLAYTPLKRRTVFNTFVGAVPGALPPMIGWAAATGRVDGPAWMLFAILFVWQLPHFFAIAWMYRDDYARGGFRMLPHVDPTGRWTGLAMVAGSAALTAASLLPRLAGDAGALYVAGAIALGAALCGFAWRAARRLDRRVARGMVLATVVYLPLLLGLLLIDRLGG